MKIWGYDVCRNSIIGYINRNSVLSAFVRSRIADKNSIYYLFIDEIQYAISKEEMKNRDTPVRLYSMLNGLMRLGNVGIYVTGSNSKLSQFRY